MGLLGAFLPPWRRLGPVLGCLASSAATAEARSGANLLALKLEAITTVYGSKEPDQYKDLQPAYTVNWESELGEGTYGKVYVGTKGSAGGSVAIKLLRDKEADVFKGLNAVFAADEEVRRHVALGLHPNVVGLVDVGLFRQPPHRPRCNSWSAHIGLVFDLYEIDVRQFLKKSSFTQGGMRHVLNSVLEGLRFIHDRGCIHCDLKPANIFMRGAIHYRGCFEREGVALHQFTDWDGVEPCPHSRTEVAYQIPHTFEVRDGKGGRRNAYRVLTVVVRIRLSSNHGGYN